MDEEHMFSDPVCGSADIIVVVVCSLKQEALPLLSLLCLYRHGLSSFLPSCATVSPP